MNQFSKSSAIGSAQQQHTIPWVHLLVVLGGILVSRGVPVPSGNEYVYLLLPVRRWNPHFLANDWTFSLPWNAHFAFDCLVAPFTGFLSIVVIGWVGRILSWTATLLAMFRLGERFEVPRSLTATAILLWLANGQSIVAGEWIFGGFEAKCLAHPLLLFALDAFLQGKNRLGAVLLGLTFSFHPAVGMWGSFAIGFTLLILGAGFRQLLSIVVTVLGFSLPGLIPLLLEMIRSQRNSFPDWQFLALVRLPHHLDPFSWPLRSILSLHLMFLFNWLYTRKIPNRNNSSLHFLLLFQMGLGLAFELGVLARAGHLYSSLNYMPFRLAPVYIPLFFLLSVFRAYKHNEIHSSDRVTAGLALLCILSMYNPISYFIDQFQETRRAWAKTNDDLVNSFRWVAQNAPQDAVVVLPPWRSDSYYHAQRAQVANWQWVSLSGTQGWRQRIEALAGSEWESAKDGGERMKEMERGYSRLTMEQIRQLALRFKCSFMVTQTDYPIPVRFHSGSYKVYDLNDLSSAAAELP